MDTVLLGIKVLNAIGSTDVVVSSLSSLNRSALNIGHLITCIGKYNNTQIVNELNKLDIENRIEVIKLLLQDIEKTENPEVIMRCVDDIQKTIDKIYVIVDKIYNAIRYNNSLWLMKTWRSDGCEIYLENLKAEKEILKERFNVLLEISRIYNIKITKPKLRENTLVTKEESLNFS